MPAATTAKSDSLEQRFGHDFADKNLLKTALTHSSTGADANYERLEFLGDRVLGLAVAELLYAKFPGEAEGDLAKRLAAVVQGSFLAEIAREIDLGLYIDFSESEALAGGAENNHILADVFEATIGALYLDGGFAKCQKVIEDLWRDRLDVMKEPPQHPKTRLQEWAQAQSLPLPVYAIIDQQGPDHAPVFKIELQVEGHKPLTVEGPSRQAAEKLAAQDFLDLLDRL